MARTREPTGGSAGLHIDIIVQVLNKRAELSWTTT
jgi:hypothetical protein